jgi:hypothetical protein
LGQLKQQQSCCDEAKQVMELSFKRIAEQLNKKFTGLDKSIIGLNEQNYATTSKFEHMKQVFTEQFDEINSKLDSQRRDELEQSGYDINLGQSR